MVWSGETKGQEIEFGVNANTVMWCNGNWGIEVYNWTQEGRNRMFYQAVTWKSMVVGFYSGTLSFDGLYDENELHRGIRRENCCEQEGIT